jgi:hypothetical protein
MALDKIDRGGGKSPSPRKIKPNEDTLNQIRFMVLDLYITNNNKDAAYDLFRRATMGAEYAPIASSRSTAVAWFNKPENASYLEYRRREITSQHFNAYCKQEGIVTSDFQNAKNENHSELLKMSPDEIREKNYLELEDLKGETDDPMILQQIIKQQSELMAAKRKDSGEELSATDKLIFYYLPASLCDDCPNKHVIEKRYAHLPNVEIEIIEDDEDDEARD